MGKSVKKKARTLPAADCPEIEMEEDVDDPESSVCLSSDSDSRVGASGEGATRETSRKRKEKRDRELDDLREQNKVLLKLVDELRHSVARLESNSKSSAPVQKPANSQASVNVKSPAQAPVNVNPTPSESALKKPRVPIIITSKADTAQIAKVIHEQKIDAVISRKARTAQLKPKTPEAHKQLWEHMTSRAIEGHTNSATASAYPRRWICRGLDDVFTPQEIAEEIERLSGAKVKVYPLYRGSRGDPKVRVFVDEYAVTAENDAGVMAMRKIESMLHHEVHWSVPDKPDIQQCFRCQSFNHTANFCNYRRRCVKCDQHHEPGQCLNNDSAQPPFCVNCNEPGHPANFGGCPVRKQRIKQIQEIRRQKEEQKYAMKQASSGKRTFYQTSHIKDGISFVSAMGHPSASQQQSLQVQHQQQRPTQQSTINPVGQIMGLSLSELNAKILFEVNDFKRRGEVVRTKEDKDALIATILASIHISNVFNI